MLMVMIMTALYASLPMVVCVCVRECVIYDIVVVLYFIRFECFTLTDFHLFFSFILHQNFQKIYFMRKKRTFQNSLHAGAGVQ